MTFKRILTLVPAALLLRGTTRHLGRSGVLCLLLAGSVVNSVLAQVTPQSALTPEQKALIEALRTAKPAPMLTHIEAPLAPTSPGDLESVDLVTGRTLPRSRSNALSAPVNTFPRSLPGYPGSPPRGVVTFPSITGALELPSPPLIAAAPPNRITYPYSFPWATVFKLLVRFTANQQDVYYLCSASSLSSFHLLTAGQCLYNHDILGNGSNVAGYAQGMWAWPAQTDVVGAIGVPDFPYGVARGIHGYSYTAWVQNSDLNRDIAWITLDRRIGDHIGWMGREANTTAASLTFDGYPAEGQYGFANNAFQYSGSASVQSYADARIYLSANVYGGQIGGPVWRYDGSHYYVEGVLSTSDRMGNAAATRLTNAVLNDIENSIASDESVLAPVARPYFIEYSLQGNVSKGLVTPTVAAGGSATVTYNLYNVGFVSSSVTVYFYLSSTPQIDAHSIFIGSVPLNNVSANSYLVQNATLTIPSGTPAGSYYVVWSWNSAVAEYPTHYVTYFWGSGGNPAIGILDVEAAITDRLLTVSNPVGSATRARTFTVPPCRVLDTRFSNPVGPISPQGTLSILVAGDLTGGGTINQGGASTCGVPKAATAVFANVVAVNAEGPGHLLVYPFGAAPPVASTLNFTTGQTIANGALVPICLPAESCAFDLNITMGPAGAHLVIDVTGYLAPRP